MDSGYSGTPLAKKLGYKPGMRCALVNAPPDYLALLGELPADVTFTTGAKGQLDLVHIFSTSQAELAAQIDRFKERIRPAGTLWLSWPKRTAQKQLGLACDITEDAIRDIVLPQGLVDVKVCAVDETWSGLKIVWRREMRGI